MKVTVTIIIALLLIFKCAYDECMGEYVDFHRDLGSYKFQPEIGNCYEIYDQYEKVTPQTCQKPLNPERRSCIHIMPGEKYCSVLKTPTNETIQLFCDDVAFEIFQLHILESLNSCFNISRADKSHKEVCQQTFDNHSIGITTPDNFTILFYSDFCSPSINFEEIGIYDDFINTFSFNPERKLCYKIYNENQELSPYTCFNKDVFISCVEDLTHVKNCEGIITQNNETIILHCSDEKENFQVQGCFKIYTADNNVHITCQKKVEERCIGITTPSNLTVLLECYFCTDPDVTNVPFVEDLRRQGTFIINYLSNEYLGKNSYLDTPELKTYNLDIPWKISKRFLRKSTVYGYWLPNTSCYGVILPSNETVILSCRGDMQKHLKQGCFMVRSGPVEKEQEQIVCVNIMDGKCVGITTPMNWFVELNCYSEDVNDSDEDVDYHKNFDNYELYPRLGHCYEVYNQYENVTPYICQRPISSKKLSCIDLIEEEQQYCLVLETPSNETIHLLCDVSEEDVTYFYDNVLNTCFNISKPDESNTEVCQQKFGDYSVGITTPDDFTIIFDSYYCSTSMTIWERESYDEFIREFLFNPEIKRCYKIFSDSQEISPFTCLDEDVFSSCTADLPHLKNCEGIITQNNETVVLNCLEDTETAQDHSCFKIYSPDGSLHITRAKRIEERCIGVTTPSNLTVLLDCYYCIKPGVRHIPYDVEQRRRSWRFVTTYLSNELLGKNSYLGKLKFQASRNSGADFLENSKDVSSIYGHWLPNTNCYGLTLDSNETVILECISRERFKYIKYGCYQVTNPKSEQEQVVCSKILDEACVGITSPMNWSITLACYSEHSKSSPDIVRDSYINRSVDKYTLTLTLNDCYQFYPSHEVNEYSCTRSTNPENYSCVHWIHDERQCLGLRTPSNEIIELICKDPSNEDAFDTDTYETNKNCFNLYNSTNQIENVCLQKFGNFSIGLTTSSNYSVLFDSFFCPTFKTSEDIRGHKAFIGNFTFDTSIRSCYKVYTPDQDISPYSCLSNEIYDACIHPLEDTSCMGITTQNNETVILECLNDTNEVIQNGCFKIRTPDNKVHIVCQKQVEEQCIGITTPSNLTVLLECHTCISAKGGEGLPIYSDKYRPSYRDLVEYFLYIFTKNNYVLEDQKYLKVYTPEQHIKIIDCFGEISSYEIHVLHGHNRCRGITLDNLETIVLSCPNNKPVKAGCFDIFSPVYDEDNEIIGPEMKVGNVCVAILNEWCVGIKTPKNRTIPLSCFYPPEWVCSVVTTPDNGPPAP